MSQTIVTKKYINTWSAITGCLHPVPHTPQHIESLLKAYRVPNMGFDGNIESFYNILSSAVTKMPV